MARRRKHWGWGFEDEQPAPAEARAAAAGLAAHLGFGSAEPEAPVPLASVALPPPRVEPPADLGALCADDPHERATHALGRSYSDVVRGFRGHFPHPPDLVALPRDERDVERVLEWADGERVAVVPYGGGTSVVGGVEPRLAGAWAGVVSLDLRRLDRLVEVDPVSRAARIQAGATGPELERRLAEHGFTLRFFPQSFEFSTLGGWLATRAAGHFATGPTRIDHLTESVRAVTPAGVWESRRLPGSGAGPSPDALLLGSEGTLGVITEAWMRVLPRPEHRRSAAVRLPTFAAGLDAVRGIAQAGLRPANCRLIDPEEARLTFAGDGAHALLALGFESSGAPVDADMEAALALCRAAGGQWEERTAREGSLGAWRDAFLRAPYLRDLLIAMGVLSETFETAITWERLPAFVSSVLEATRAAVTAVCGAGGVTCRLTHVYADGAAPYFTVLGPARRGEETEQWEAIKQAASEAIIAAGGTITHHHAVGRDHRPWYDRQRPDPFALALRGAKAAVDPRGILNPGVLLDPQPAPAAVGGVGVAA